MIRFGSWFVVGHFEIVLYWDRTLAQYVTEFIFPGSLATLSSLASYASVLRGLYKDVEMWASPQPK